MTVVTAAMSAGLEAFDYFCERGSGPCGIYPALRAGGVAGFVPLPALRGVLIEMFDRWYHDGAPRGMSACSASC